MVRKVPVNTHSEARVAIIFLHILVPRIRPGALARREVGRPRGRVHWLIVANGLRERQAVRVGQR